MTADLPRSSPATGGQSSAAQALPGERVLLNRQRAVPVRPRTLSAFLTKACGLVLPRAAGVAVCLVSDAEISRLNHAYRGKRGPTDVLSFPAVASRARRIRSAGSFHLGDIAISPAAARRNALPEGRSVEEELRVLILHGVIHLAGFDHETDRGQMVRYERRLRARLGIG